MRLYIIRYVGRIWKKLLSYILALCLAFIDVSYVLADNNTYELDNIIADTAKCIYKNAESPQVGSIGGEWAIFGLARSGYDVPDEYYQNYYKAVEKYVMQCEGSLSERKYTEYSRLILALTAIGRNPADVVGYNLLVPLGDYENTIKQGLNGPVWALLALDSGNYEMPNNSEAKIQASRVMYIDYILKCQRSDGGWSLTGTESLDIMSDVDITAMALCALAKYRDRTDVCNAIEKAISALSAMQNENSGFSSWGSDNSESAVQVMTALCELGITLDDIRFVKNGYSLLDNVLSFYQPNSGFKNVKNSIDFNQMATEQALCGLVAVSRAENDKYSLYNINDSIKISDQKNDYNYFGLPNKNKDIQYINIESPDRTFMDINTHKNQASIEALAERGIINGKTDELFDPDSVMTRAEFAVIITRSLGLPVKSSGNFSDIVNGDWYFDYINTAYYYKIVSGISDSEFNPDGIITREEAAAMVFRAAVLCGINMDMETAVVRDILAGFTDYIQVSEWALRPFAFCFRDGILDDGDIEIKPKKPVTRAEIAQMLFNMMRKAELL